MSDIRKTHYYIPQMRRNPTGHPFLFATGIECSYPVITSKKTGKQLRRDELAETRHYEFWKRDLELVKELGLQFLRYGPPYYRMHCGPDKYDWEFCDQVCAEMQRLEIKPIMDLCHFGVPDWIGNFQNPDFPRLFADYARAFARRYPWIKLYTPVNEIFITARFSGELGWWNEQLTSNQGFVTALKHAAKANLLAEKAIVQEQPEALFILSESTEYFHAKEPAALGRAGFLNEQRFLSLDLSYGRDVSAGAYQYLRDCGMTRQEYYWFMEHGSEMKPYSIMGNDYYDTNEHSVPAEGPIEPAGEIFGYYIITRQYYDRYHLPVMHTETNVKDESRGPSWLWKAWSQMLRLKQDGVPIIGFTWFSLTDQVDWDTALREDNGNVIPCGLVDLDRNIREVGHLYRKLVEDWCDILPMESRGVDLTPGEYDQTTTEKQKRDLRIQADRPPSQQQHVDPAKKSAPETPQGR